MGITKPSKAVFWIALIVGAFAIVNQYFFKINIPIISSVPNMALLSLAFILLTLGVVIKKF
jgi:hypothetical protein